MPIYGGKAPYLFISYSHTDNDVIREITQMLDENGCRYWYDTGLHSGNDWNEVIAGKLRDCAACLLLLSPAAASSKYVKNELTFVENMEIPLHPVLIKDYVGASIRALPADIAMTLGRIQMVSMERNYYEKLLRGLPSTVFALSNEADFKIKDGVLEKYIGDGGDVTIPAGVTSIGERAFYDCSGLTSITIPDSVTSIGDHVFHGCESLTSITIPNSVTSIGGGAFEGCKSLTSVMIPDSVTSIGSYAFYGTTYYHNADNWENGVLYIGNHLIKANRISGAYSIKSGTKCIADHAFSSCFGLTSITIPDSVTNIGNEAFSVCFGLTSINIPDSVTNIGKQAFWECTGLTSITIPDSVTSIGNSAFSSCSSLMSITVDGGNTVYHSAGNCIIHTKSKTLVVGCRNSVFPADGSVTSIVDYAFDGCAGLTSIAIPDSVTSIGSSAFSGCKSLTSITIPDGVTNIGSGAFSSCTGLTSITIPDSVTSIGSNAFSNCTGLTSVTIGNSVTSIGDSAFCWCFGLTSITIPNSVTSIDDDAFSGCSGLTSITVEDSNSVYHSAGNCLIETEAKTLIAGCQNNEIPIDGSVTSIRYSAFRGCTGLTSINIPDSVTSIGEEAFYYCAGLTSITIPDSVTSIGNNAFYGCDSLTSITFQGTKAQWNAITKGHYWNDGIGNYTVSCTDGQISK